MATESVRSVELRPVETSDARFLYKLLKSRPPEANISHKAMPPYWRHWFFVRSRPYSAWYVIHCEFDNYTFGDVGAIYLTKRGEIGLHLAPEARGRGVGAEALAILLKHHPLPRYLANVAPGNEAGRRFWEREGFRPIQVTYELPDALEAGRDVSRGSGRSGG